jgi:hypothetical protein
MRVATFPRILQVRKEMHRIHLTDDLAGEDHDIEVLLYDLRHLDIPHPFETTVYPTTGTKSRFRTVLSTTSKDVHLSLGRMISSTQSLLCKVLDDAFREHGDAQMSFSFDPKEGTSKQRVLFVARTTGSDLLGDFVTYHLSPGN